MAQNSQPSDGSFDEHNELSQDAVREGVKRREYGVEEWADELGVREDHIRGALIRTVFDDDDFAAARYTQTITADDVPDDYDKIMGTAMYREEVIVAARRIAYWSDQDADEYLQWAGIDATADDILGGDGR